MIPSRVDLLGSSVRYWIHNPEADRTIVMVHGFRGNHVGLAQIINHLGAYRVIVADLPGCGASTPMSETPHNVDGYATFVEEFLVALHIDQPVLLGHSLGSLIASHVAATRADLVAELILVNPLAVSPNFGINRPVTKLVENYYWLASNTPEALGQRILRSRTFVRLTGLALVKTHDSTLRRSIYRHHLSDLEWPQNRKVIAESFADSISRTAADDTALIKNRTLLIAGEKDAIAPVKYQRLLSEALADSTLAVIPRVGHFVPLETPAAAAHAISVFLG